MAVSVGQLIQASHYNDLANTVNKIFADSYPNSEYAAVFAGTTVVNATDCNSIFSIHESEYPTTSPGPGPFVLFPAPTDTDFLAVQVGNEVLVGVGYSIDYTNATITFTTPVPAATRVVVYNRSNHRYGYGNSAVVNNLQPQDIVESVHINGLINRLNISLEHVGSTTQLGIVPIGQTILASNSNDIDNIINSQLYANGTHLTVDVASSISGPNFTRTLDWADRLEGIFSYSFTDYQSARHFFNGGGEIRWGLALTGNVANQGFLNWDALARRMGTLRMNHSNVQQSGSGGITNAKGFYHLTEDWQLVFTSGGPVGSGSYGGYGGYSTSYNDIVAEFFVRYVTIGDQHQIQVKVVLDDTIYPTVIQGTTSFVSSTLQPDTITQNSVTYSVTGPTIAVVEDFNSGNDS